MKKAKLLSLFLALFLLLSFAVPGSLAEETNDDVDWKTGNGLNIRKTATKNADDSYTITLEAYATGSKVITEVTEDVPTDIVLVLDQSGSMDDNMATYDFRPYSNRNNDSLYGYRHNGGSSNLYYPLSDGGYASISVGLVQGQNYTAIAANTPNDNPILGSRTNYYSNRNNLFALVAGEYQKVTVERELNRIYYDYTYTLPNGTVIAESRSRDSMPIFSGITGNVLYLRSADQSKNVYTYTYTDSQGTHVIGTSTGFNTQPTNFTLYDRYSTGNVSKLNALKTAVNAFASSVATKAKGADGNLGTEDDINHRIAVVGFASNNDDYNNQRYENTEVFVGATQYRYNNGASGQYGNAFQSMNTAAGVNNVSASINALAANGGTFTNLGMEMANGILNANPVQEGQQRNRVVIVFTDGIPGARGYDSSVANSAINYGNTIKNNRATIYTIGVFEGADAGSEGSSTGNNETARANWFMQRLSSGGGTPNSGYYLSAADSGTLNSIFQQISQNIETGGTMTTLTEDAVIRDIISPAFMLPSGTTAENITLETWACTGVDGSGAYTWNKNSDAMGAEAVISSTDSANLTTSNNQLSVTGFNFAENYVGEVIENSNVTGYRGHKLVISFTVMPREGFLGGNNVTTNTSAGIFENEDASNPVMTFDQPKVDVPLAEPVVSVPDTNVYLGAYLAQTVPEDAVKMGAVVTIGGYEIDFSKANDPDAPYGLQPWQVEYVNISIEAAAEGNNGSFENIQEDISYTVTVTVSPKTPGTSDDQSETASGQGMIHVFKPKLTFKDSNVWYDGAMPDEFNDDNLTNKTWINHDGSKTHKDQGVEMLNTEPELTLSYTPGITGATVNTKQDIPVKVDVTMSVGGTENNINSRTTFEHLPCNAMACGWEQLTPAPSNGNPAFLLHVNTCSLTITKTGGENEPYVFTILKDGEKYTEASITGNGSITISELPVGTYTIEEDTGWSWRFNPSYGGTAELSETNPTATLTCTNSISENKWLNGFSEVMKNIFGGNSQ